MVDDGNNDDELDAQLLQCLDAIDACLGDGDCNGARRRLDEARSLAGEDNPEVRYAEACIVWEERGAEHAVPLLQAVVAADREHSDAWYALARAAEELGDDAGMIEHHLRVHALDARHDREARLGQPEELDHIERVAYEVLSALPSPFAERLVHVPVLLERRPSRDLVRDGFDPRALGLFEGPTHGDTSTAAPTRIVLFVNNLLADFPDDPELSEQIEITLLHEIGHYFGLDEDDMERLGLD
jgi:predicted Zn-dependent protease with MMP-like domain